MKKFGFLFFLVAMVIITMSSSTCRTPPADDDLLLIDTTDTTKPVTTPNVAGPLRVAVRLYTVAGNFAGGARVNIARTFDSVNNEKYFAFQTTDTSGYAEFRDLPVRPDGKEKSYFLNASVTYAGEELKSTNPGGNGPKETRLNKGIPKNEALIVTAP